MVGGGIHCKSRRNRVAVIVMMMTRRTRASTSGRRGRDDGRWFCLRGNRKFTRCYFVLLCCCFDCRSLAQSQKECRSQQKLLKQRPSMAIKSVAWTAAPVLHPHSLPDPRIVYRPKQPFSSHSLEQGINLVLAKKRLGSLRDSCLHLDFASKKRVRAENRVLRLICCSQS